ncbi:hypothetical protein HanPI659440_Chr06g0240061 [Helianthus annuus]|nr:hypothetical protein HanPI659440_Chr06g0240061 [Helianthus annuus]
MYLHPPKIFNKKPKLHHHQQPPDRLKILSLATKKPPLSMNKNPNFLPHSLQGMSLELSIMDMDDKLVAKGNVSLSTMETDDKLVAKVNCTTRLEGEMKFLDNNIAYQTMLSSPRFFCALHLGPRRGLCTLSAPRAFNNYDIELIYINVLGTCHRSVCEMQGNLYKYLVRIYEAVRFSASARDSIALVLLSFFKTR